MQFAVLQEYNEALGSDKSVINYAHHNLQIMNLLSLCGMQFVQIISKLFSKVDIGTRQSIG